MKRLLLLSLFLLPFTTFAAGPDVKGITRDWGFSGPFGKYDKPDDPLENIGSLTDLGKAFGVSMIFRSGMITRK